MSQIMKYINIFSNSICKNINMVIPFKFTIQGEALVLKIIRIL